jgi:hypothetical protein
VNPPPNIDITTCYGLTYENDQKLEACSACCDSAGQLSASYLNHDHCTCGTNPPDDRDTVCAAETPGEPSGDACQACCDTAGYNGSVGFGGTPSSCTCFGRTDTAVCAGSLAHESPDEACQFCCLENGFLSTYFVGIGDMECGCIAP